MFEFTVDEPEDMLQFGVRCSGDLARFTDILYIKTHLKTSKVNELVDSRELDKRGVERAEKKHVRLKRLQVRILILFSSFVWFRTSRTENGSEFPKLRSQNRE